MVAGDLKKELYTVAKKTVKAAINLLITIVEAVLKMLRIIDFPVPLYARRRGTGGVTARDYYEGGISTALPIIAKAIDLGVDMGANIKVLDFGCGAARQLLHFTRNFPIPDYSACDVDQRNVDFVAKNYRQVKVYRNGFNPPLRYDDGSFDIIYSVSVFSHLPLDYMDKWLGELFRITAEGGYCFLSTMGSKGLSDMSKRLPGKWRESEQVLREKGFIYKEHDDFWREKKFDKFLPSTSKFLALDRPTGVMIISPEYALKVCRSRGFQGITVIEGIVGYLQDLVVLKKG